ncbi:MAG: HAMP domain-containing histidine kinase [Lachnospiraceae bacterium]|nr:HAMP domain-containing histidine kinase [Lachnospiraceae bacterium]
MKNIKKFKERNLFLQLIISYVAFLLLVGVVFVAAVQIFVHIEDRLYEGIDYDHFTNAQAQAMQAHLDEMFAITLVIVLVIFVLLALVFAMYMGFHIRKEETALVAARQKMLTDISHDLKTPITVIQGYSKAIVDGVIPEENMDKYLNTIYQKSNHLADLINSFYEYSRLEHPDFELTMEPGDLSEYLREYVAGKYQELELAGYTLDVDIPERPIYLSFDHVELRRVFENIISNTTKHNPSGTMIYVSMEFVRDRHQVRIRLGDDGEGIAEHLRAHVFEPFVVGDESRNSKHGTGLGMSVARRVVEAHGGTIRLLEETETSWSTMYEIILPMNRGSV